MRSDDPRHGTNAGYVAGCRCDRCGHARFRARKLWALYGRRWELDEITRLITPWTEQGLSLNAIAVAAGLPSGFLSQPRESVRASTAAALAKVTEADFAPHARVDADLTRRRVFSLMAAGHRLNEMPIRRTGTWRSSDFITAGLAREVRAHFKKLEATMGTDRQVASRALNAGHLPPLAWDDPGTLGFVGLPPIAMPTGRRDLLAEYAHLIEGGESHAQACKQLGVESESIDRARERRKAVA